MRVLHVGKFYYPYRGGMETALRAICESHGGKAAVQVLVANGAFRTVIEKIDGFEVTRVGSLGRLFSVPLCPSFPLWLKRRSADLIVLHEPNPLASLSYFLARPPARLVVWFHSDVVRQRALYPFYSPLLERCLQLASRIVVASPKHLEHTPVLARFQDKCVVIPFGIDLARFALTPSGREKVAAIRRRANAQIVLFVGRLTYYKGLEYLLEAIEHVEARLLVVGSGPLGQALRARVQRKGLRDRVEFLGEIQEEALVACYHACDVFVLPSVERSEAFGIAQLEAMACGKPVVSTNLPSGVPWVNQDGKTGIIVEPRNPQALSQAINLLLLDETLRSKYGENGRRRVEVEFTIERMHERMHSLCEEVLNEL